MTSLASTLAPRVSVPSLLLVEDHEPTAAEIIRITEEAGFRTAGVARDLASARAYLPLHGVDAVLLDLGLPDGDGIDFVLRAREVCTTPILVLSATADPSSALAALRRGAHGFLYKDDLDQRLTTALREVLAGQAPISSAAAGALLAQVRELPAPDLAPKLTKRQTQVLRLLATGAGYAEIARELSIGLNTVRTHVSSVYQALGVENRAEATNFAWRMRLVD